MATKWVGAIECLWCGGKARAGIEQDGEGRCYRVVCTCGANTQAGRDFPTGIKIAQMLASNASQQEAGSEWFTWWKSHTSQQTAQSE
jgi:hypothetical protein